MLELKNIVKIFNAGTVNEKVALNDFSRRKRRGKINDAQCRCRCLSG